MPWQCSRQMSVASSLFYETLSLDVFRSFVSRRSPPQVLVDFLQDEPVAVTDKMEAFESDAALFSGRHGMKTFQPGLMLSGFLFDLSGCEL